MHYHLKNKTMYNEEIDRQIAQTMKNGERIKLSVWRAIKNEFVKFKTSGSNIELTEEKELQIINKMVSQRKDSIEQFKQAGRTDLVNEEEQELNILISLLPKEPTEEEIETLINDFVSKKESISMRDMKDVMSFVKTTYPTANGGTISKIFKEKYIN